MAFIDSSVVNVALPKMESDLATTLSSMTWVINAYTLCMSALLLIGGAAADQVGRRRIFMIGITIFVDCLHRLWHRAKRGGADTWRAPFKAWARRC